MSNKRHIHALHILEFEKVAAEIAGYAACSLGKERIMEMHPYSAIEAALEELDGVDEALRELYRMGPLPFGGITDIRPHLARAAIGGVLGPDSLLAVADFIYGGRRVRHELLNSEESVNYPKLRELGETLYDARQIEQELRQAITDEATVHDGASQRLRQLRHDRRQAESRIRQILEQMLRSQQKLLQEPVITVRGTSLCLPVRVEYKNQVRGVIHDYSASGATVFIEPQAAVEMGHRVQELLLEEEREVERILQRLSASVASVADNLEQNAQTLAILDAWFAKAQYAKAHRCEKPGLNAAKVWRLSGARHPLIPRETAVPLDLSIGEEYSMVVITGPNTGGKTVALKTVGLLTLLAMSGCFIPARAGSEVGWSDSVYVDIGDEQSIEQSLSTFSSHMTNIVSMLDQVNDKSLVLLDELGAGTDPAEGAALAIAILNDLHVRGCTVMATTHYAELKAYAFESEHAVNASVEFDVATLRPTYRLLVGVPGRSNALAIAKRLGLPDFVIEEARKQLSTSDIRVEDLIRKMESARREADEARAQAVAHAETAEQLRTEWQQKWDVLQGKERDLLAKATQEAAEIIRTAQAEAQRVISELRSKKHSGVKDHELVELRKALEGAMPENPVRPGSASPSQSGAVLRVGATVRVTTLNQKGEVVELSGNGKDVVVQLGPLKTKVRATDVEVLSEPKETHSAAPVSLGRGRMNKRVPLELDVRGMTVDEAVALIDKYLDDAVVAHVARVTVIHGKGTGALRDGVRRHLAGQKQVKSWSVGGPGEGGDGATVVEVAF